jgi:hypothetical protein
MNEPRSRRGRGVHGERSKSFQRAIRVTEDIDRDVQRLAVR